MASSVPFAVPYLGTLMAERYRLRQVLGRGGLGVVYAADDIYLPRRVALKLVRLDPAHDPAARRWLFREVQASAHIQDPHRPLAVWRKPCTGCVRPFHMN